MLAERLGKPEQARTLKAKANALQAKFAKDFWSDKLGFYALALDGDNKQCDVVSSDPGHLLFTGILNTDQNARVAARMMEGDMFSGWGIRTLSAKEIAYNPLSYHNGSVWPHDNAIIAKGFGAAKRSDLASQVLDAMFRVAKSEPDLRLPELFCGFESSYSDKPIWYPVSCSPQAWAAGSVFMMLQGSLGLTIDAQSHLVRLAHPTLPTGVSRMFLRGVWVGDDRVNLTLTRLGKDVRCETSGSDNVKTIVE
jgi:glycogen debranching enzyme